jgi:cell wall-associated NlpC family hydrolase
MNLALKLISVSLIALTSFTASAQKRMASNDRARSNTSANARFLDNVVIENDNEVVNTTTTTSRRYRVENNNLQDLEETTENSKVAKTEIEKKKKNGNTALYTFIDEWYGTPYKYGGTTNKGIDCSAFVRELCREVYGARLQRTSAEQFEETEFISSQDKLKEGDLVFFKIRSRNISHVGLYLGDGKFVHSSRSKGVVISDLNDNYWSRYYVGGGKLK